MSEFKSEQIKSVLKNLLKKKMMTYQDAAEKLECSVPTVKRILGSEEISLPRLLKFCDFLDVTLTDLETLIEFDTPAEERYTLAQEEFLAKNPHFFAYLYSLYSFSPQEIANKHGLSSRSTDKYLLYLEKNELIKVNGKLKAKPYYENPPKLGHGRLAKAYYRNFIKNGADFFYRNISEKLNSAGSKDLGGLAHFSLSSVKCTKNTYLHFAEEQKKSWIAFSKLASYEEKSLTDENLVVAVYMDASALVDKNDAFLEVLDNSFGKIKNL